MIFSWMLLAALFVPTSQQVVLTDDVYSVPAGEWRYVEFVVSQQPAAVRCDLDLVSGGPAGVRVELLDRSNLELYTNRKPHQFLAAAAVASQTLILQAFHSPGTYAVAMINNAGHQARVRLHLAMDFSGIGQTAGASYLSPQRRLTVILLSFAAFFAMVTFSARKLLRAIKA